MEDLPLKKLVLTIPFKNHQWAFIVSEVLNVDKEFKGSGIQRTVSGQDNNLLVIFEGADYKKLRVTVNALLKNILLIVKTIKGFSID